MRLCPLVLRWILRTVFPLFRAINDAVTGHIEKLIDDHGPAGGRGRRRAVPASAVRQFRAESSILVLRGMYVSEERQRQGLGTRLLALASSEIGSAECWCVPYAHLVEFYSRIGCRLGASPHLLRTRLEPV